MSKNKQSQNLDDEAVFWDEYTKIEISGNTKHWFLNYVLKLFFLNDTSETEETDKIFMVYYLTQSKYFGMVILIINFAALVLLEVFTWSGNSISVTEIHDTKFHVLVQQVNIWLFFTAVCLAYFILFHFAPSKFDEWFQVSAYDMWLSIGHMIRISFSLILVLRLARHGHTIFEVDADSVDMNSSPLDGDKVYTFVFLQMMIDVVQTVLFSVLPFAWPWSIHLSFIQACTQTVRFYAIARGMLKGTEHIAWLVYTVYISMLNIFAIVTVSASTFQRSAAESFRNTQRQRAVMGEKERLVSLLCAEIKYPLQCVTQAANTLADIEAFIGKPVGSAPRESGRPSQHKRRRHRNQPITVTINSPVSITSITTVTTPQSIDSLRGALLKGALRVNHLSDDLLLLTKIVEGRAPFALTDRVNIDALVVEATDVSINRELVDQVEMDTPSRDVLTNKERLAALLRHALFFATHHLLAGETSMTSISSGPTGDIKSVPVENTARLKITIEGDALLRVDVYCVSDRAAAVCAADTYHDSVVTLCGELVKSYGGDFHVEGGQHYEITIPCVAIAPDAAASPVSPRSNRSVSRTRSAVQACAILSDAVLEPLVSDVMHEVNPDEESSQDEDCPSRIFASVAEFARHKGVVFNVVLMSDLTVIEALRATGYAELIVYVSGGRSYLDSRSKSPFDYVLPLPCMESDLLALARWLDKSGDTTPVVHSPSVAYHPPSHAWMGVSKIWLSLYELAVLSPYNSILRMCRWFFVDTHYGITKIPASSLATYSKWRLINPTHTVMHHTNMVSVKYFIYAVHIIAQVILSPEPEHLLGNTANIPILLLIVLRYYIYSWILVPLQRQRGETFYSMHNFWWLLTVFGVITGIITLTMVMFSSFCTVEADNCVSVLTMSHIPTAEILNLHFGGYTGRTVLITTINCAGLFVAWLVYFNWPMQMWFMLLNGARSMLVVTFIAQRFVSPLMLKCVVLLYSLLLAGIFSIEVYFETIYRHEYIALRATILKQRFLDRSLAMCSRDISGPLSLMVEAERSLTQCVAKKVLSGTIALNHELMWTMDSMKSGTLLISQLARQLQYVRTMDRSQTLSPIVDVSKLGDTIFLREVVMALLHLLSITTDPLSIQLFLDVDISLTVVRMNKRLLTTLVANAVLGAVSNIKRQVTTADWDKSAVLQQVLVSIKPLKGAASDKPLRFIDTRQLVVNVLDTSRNISRSHLSKGRFGEEMCRDMALAAAEGALYDSDALEHITYGAYSRFTLPYKLCVDSAKAAGLVNNIPLQPKDSAVNCVMELVDRQAGALLQAYLNQNGTPPVAGSTSSSPGATRGKPSSRTPTRAERNEQLLVERSKLRGILFLVSGQPDAIAEYSRYATLFEMNGWRCRTMFVTGPASALDLSEGCADCILVDHRLHEALHDIALCCRVRVMTHVLAVLHEQSEDIAANTKGLTDTTAVHVNLVKPVLRETFNSLAQAVNRSILSQLMFVDAQSIEQQQKQ